MSGMFWIALEVGIQKKKKRFNIMLSLAVKKVDAIKFDGVAEFDDTSFVPCVPALMLRSSY